MRVFFDTNVYSNLYKSGGVEVVRAGLRARRARVVATDVNLFEIYAIPDESSRRGELRALTQLASEYLEYPQSWKQAREVRNEIGRCHPEWLTRFGARASIRSLLERHREHWKEARLGEMPPDWAFRSYLRSAGTGVRHNRRSQKEIRRLRLEDAGRVFLTQVGTGFVGAGADDPEVYWRVITLSVWHNALLKQHPASRDYRDWIAPYVKINLLEDRAFARFWMQEVDAAHVPRNRIASLVSFYQTDAQVTPGNAQDQNHACMAIDADRFLTADRPFCTALSAAINGHMPDLPPPVLIERNAGCIADQVLAALE